MTLAGKLISLFPAFQLIAMGLSVYYATTRSFLVGTTLLITSTYLLPLIAFRIHNAFLPLKRAVFDLSKKEYCRWWGAYQLQAVFTALPALENWMKVVPQIYSTWLRLWGSQIGSNVYWAPSSRIEDRSLMNIGSGVAIGHDTCLIAHFVTTNAAGKTRLFVNKIHIGENTLIGAFSRLGPGCRIKPNARIPATFMSHSGLTHVCWPIGKTDS